MKIQYSSEMSLVGNTLKDKIISIIIKQKHKIEKYAMNYAIMIVLS